MRYVPWHLFLPSVDIKKKTIFSGANQMRSSNLTAKGDYFWLDHFQTHPVFLHSSISSDRISLSLQNIFILFFFYMYKNNILIYLANKLNSHFYIQYGLLWGRNYSRLKLFKLFKDSTTKKTSYSSVQKCR